MDLVKVMETFPTQADCIEYLERLRWHGSPECPQCESTHVRRRNEQDTGRIGRWNCHECPTTFKVTHGTLFQGTKIPLQKWFLAISLMVNAKKSLSSCQLARDLGLKQKACWRMMMAIRAEMGKDNVLLQGIIEADETYIGGTGKKNYDKETGEPKRGRGEPSEKYRLRGGRPRRESCRRTHRECQSFDDCRVYQEVCENRRFRTLYRPI